MHVCVRVHTHTWPHILMEEEDEEEFLCVPQLHTHTHTHTRVLSTYAVGRTVFDSFIKVTLQAMARVRDVGKCAIALGALVS
jgi:hypothetical protein